MKAAVALADLYTRGEGVEVNCEQARILLLVASGKRTMQKLPRSCRSWTKAVVRKQRVSRSLRPL